MAVHYAGASATVKRYVSEQGSAWLRALFASEAVVFSQLAIAEIASTLGRRAKEGSLTIEQSNQFFLAFLSDLDEYTVVSVDEEVVLEAAALSLAIPAPLRLRASDAIHLATARASLQAAGRAGAAAGHFLTADVGLAAAATWAGLAVTNPRDYP